jgi:hypothetical protein
MRSFSSEKGTFCSKKGTFSSSLQWHMRGRGEANTKPGSKNSLERSDVRVQLGGHLLQAVGGQQVSGAACGSFLVSWRLFIAQLICAIVVREKNVPFLA